MGAGQDDEGIWESDEYELGDVGKWRKLLKSGRGD